MPKRDVALLLEDILAAIGKIERYTAGLGREAFLGDEKTIDAVVRNLEIIGEAARAVLDEVVEHGNAEQQSEARAMLGEL